MKATARTWSRAGLVVSAGLFTAALLGRLELAAALFVAQLGCACGAAFARDD